MSFTINSKLSFIDSFQFLRSSLNSLFKNLGNSNLKYFSQEFDNNVLDLIEQKRFYPYEYISGFEKFKTKLRSKEKLYSLLADTKTSDKESENVLNVWKKLEIKTIKDFHELYLKCDVLLLADLFKKKLSKKQIKELGIMSKSLFERTRFKLGCNA